MSPIILKDEFHTMFDYIEHKLHEWDNKKFQDESWEECEKNSVEYVDNKMQDFDGVVVPRVERKKMVLAPTLWRLHNNSYFVSPCPDLSLDT